MSCHCHRVQRDRELGRSQFWPKEALNKLELYRVRLCCLKSAGRSRSCPCAVAMTTTPSRHGKYFCTVENKNYTLLLNLNIKKPRELLDQNYAHPQTFTCPGHSNPRGNQLQKRYKICRRPNHFDLLFYTACREGQDRSREPGPRTEPRGTQQGHSMGRDI